MTMVDRIRIHTERLPQDMQREVLDFVEFLEPRRGRLLPVASQRDGAPSCLDLAQAHGLVGCIKDTPADLSTNPAYLQDYGE